MENNEMICKRGEIASLDVRYAQNGALVANFNLLTVGRAYDGKPVQIHKMACHIYRKENFDKYLLLQDGQQVACFGYWKSTPMKSKEGREWELNQLEVVDVYVKLGYTPMNQDDVKKVVDSFNPEGLPFS